MKRPFLKKTFVLLTVFLVASFVLTGCRKKGASGDRNLDSYLPEDVVMMAHLQNTDDYEKKLKAISKAIGFDEDAFKTAAVDALKADYDGETLSFVSDLIPALGDTFEAAYGVSGQAKTPGQTDVYGVATLQHPELLEKSLNTLVSAGEFRKSRFNKYEAYVDKDGKIYLGIQAERLFVANRPEALVAMIEMDPKQSLEGNKAFQAALKKIGTENYLYGVLFPQKISSLMGSELEGPEDFSLNRLKDVVHYQAYTFDVQNEGMLVDVYVQADEVLAKEHGVSFDAVPRSQAYLLSEVPTDGLALYAESYGLRQTIEQAEAIGDDSGALDELGQATTKFLSADLNREILPFLGKAYAFALHKNVDSLIPGMSLFVDVSEDRQAAESVMNQLDGEVQSLMALFASSIPGAVSKDTVSFNGAELNHLNIDLSSLSGESAPGLISILGAAPVELTYGVAGDRLLISTANVWTKGGETIAEAPLYKTLKKSLKGVDNGLMYMDMAAVQDYFDSLMALREPLGLGTEKSSEGLELFAKYLEFFEGGIAASENDAYSTHTRGIILYKKS